MAQLKRESHTNSQLTSNLILKLLVHKHHLDQIKCEASITRFIYRTSRDSGHDTVLVQLESIQQSECELLARYRRECFYQGCPLHRQRLLGKSALTIMLTRRYLLFNFAPFYDISVQAHFMYLFTEVIKLSNYTSCVSNHLSARMFHV
jgi:hypothetical protein